MPSTFVVAPLARVSFSRIPQKIFLALSWAAGVLPAGGKVKETLDVLIDPQYLPAAR